MDESLEFFPDYVDRDGFKRPKLRINGYHNKDHGMPVRNVLSCGCEYNHKKTN